LSACPEGCNRWWRQWLAAFAGERSRVCVARALLQQADLRVLDESFATLDPETLDRVLECVVRRSETLVVVSHA